MPIADVVAPGPSQPEDESRLVPAEVAGAYNLATISTGTAAPVGAQTLAQAQTQAPALPQAPPPAPSFPNPRARVAYRIDGQRLLLWRSMASPARLAFALSCLEHVSSRGFPFCPRLVTAEGGRPFVCGPDDSLYYATSCPGAWLGSRACNYGLPGDATFVARAIARLHRAAEGFPRDAGPVQTGGPAPTGEGRQPRWENSPGRALATMCKRLAEMVEFRLLARHKLYPTSFDAGFLTWVDHFTCQTQQAIESLAQPEVMRSWQAAFARGGFCHHSLDRLDIVISLEPATGPGGLGPVSTGGIVDFEPCVAEARAHDLCTLICQIGWATGWSGAALENAIGAYHAVHALEPHDLRIAAGIALFPLRFWRLARRFYHNRKPWSEKAFRGRLALLTRLEPAREMAVGPHGLIASLAARLAAPTAAGDGQPEGEAAGLP